FENDYAITPNPNLTPLVFPRYSISPSQLLISLHELATFLNSWSLPDLPWDAAYPDRLYEVEYRVLLALFNGNGNDDEEPRLAVQPAGSYLSQSQSPSQRLGVILLHAMLLFIYTNLRETPVGGVLRARLLRRLRDALAAAATTGDDLLLDDIVCTFPEEMLWVSLVGAATAAAAPCGSIASVHEQDLVPAILSQIRLKHGLWQWEEARLYLRRMPTFTTDFRTGCIKALEEI
ncbi:uncharacterized protein B0I36DRAFT_358773, partial [Microdochium trichocladiopsis]